MNNEPNVFISYAREDYDVAEEIFEYLKTNGANPWLDKINLLPGQDWETEISQAIKNSDYFIACLSSLSIGKRGFIQAEIKKAIKVLEEIPYNEIFFIPVRLEEVELPYSISDKHWCDWFKLEDRIRLLHSMGLRYQLSSRNKYKEDTSKLKKISEASRKIIQTIPEANLDERYKVIVSHLAKILEAESATLFLIDRDDSQYLVKVASWGQKTPDFEKGRRFKIHNQKMGGLIGYIAYQREMFNYFNYFGDELVKHYAVAGKPMSHLKSGICASLIATPLIVEDILIGMLEAQNKMIDGIVVTDKGFTKEDEYILDIFAETVLLGLRV